MAHEHTVYMMLADSAAQAGDEQVLRKYAPLLEELALRDGHRPYLAIAERAWGAAHRLAGEYPEAETRLNKALELFEGLETRWQIGRTCEELAALAAARSDSGLAQAQLARALGAFQAMGARPDVERTQRSLEAAS